MSEAAKKTLRSDEFFKQVNAKITLSNEDVKATNPVLKQVIDTMLEKMKAQDPLFKYMYGEMMFGGSFYKGVKISKPEEFDLDLILRLPVDYDKIRFEEDRPGFVKVKLPADSYKPDWETHKKVLNKWISNSQNFLNTEELRKWFESVLTKTFLKLDKRADGWYNLPLEGNRTAQVQTKKSGPAFPLKVKCDSGNFDVDLVPVLKFKTTPNLRVFKKILTVDRPWYLVPKPLKPEVNSDLYWRFCFYRYEQALLAKNGKVKPIIRLMKKLKETQNWSSVIASYYIETLVYHELLVITNIDQCSMTSLLVYMLTKLKEACGKCSIPYYWHPDNNLLVDRKPEQLRPIQGRLERIIKDIEENSEQLLTYFLTAEERQTLAEARTPPSTPNSESSSDDSGISSPTEETLLINFLDPPQAPRDIQSMDQIAILTRTVATLADEIKTMKSMFTGELKDLKDKLQMLTEQTSAMSDVVEHLIRREMGRVNVVNQSLI